MTVAEREKYIWSRLTAAGLTPAGAAGLMGNLYAESGLNPENLQNTHEKKLGLTDAAYTAAVDAGTYTNFAGDGAGYGLAQWTYKTRKAALLAYVRAAGRSVGDLEAQVGFLLQELAGSYKGVLSTLKSAQDVRAASDAVLLQFERPADQGRPPGPAAPDTGKPTLTDTPRRIPLASCPPACLWTSSSPWRGTIRHSMLWGALGPL